MPSSVCGNPAQLLNDQSPVKDKMEFVSKKFINYAAADMQPTSSKVECPSYIIMLPHANIDKSFFTKYLNKYNIQGLIIVTDMVVDTTYLFKKPNLISLINEKQG